MKLKETNLDILKVIVPALLNQLALRNVAFKHWLATQINFLFGFKCIKELHSKSLLDHELLIILEKNVIWGFTEINLFRFPLY